MWSLVMSVQKVGSKLLIKKCNRSKTRIIKKCSGIFFLSLGHDSLEHIECEQMKYRKPMQM